MLPRFRAASIKTAPSGTPLGAISAPRPPWRRCFPRATAADGMPGTSASILDIASLSCALAMGRSDDGRVLRRIRRLPRLQITPAYPAIDAPHAQCTKNAPEVIETRSEEVDFSTFSLVFSTGAPFCPSCLWITPATAAAMTRRTEHTQRRSSRPLGGVSTRSTFRRFHCIFGQLLFSASHALGTHPRSPRRRRAECTGSTVRLRGIQEAI